MRTLVKASWCSASLMMLALAVSPALAGPASSSLHAEKQASIVDTVQAYRRNCGWNNNGWNYERRGKRVACRPQHPGRGYVWYREGERFGWYHRGRQQWHHKNW